MNAITTIRVDESTLERAHRAAIRVHCPGCDEFEMAARVDLATIRDQATFGMARATDSAAVLLGEVAKLAGHAVFAQQPASALIRIKTALTLTMLAARSVDRVTRDG